MRKKLVAVCGIVTALALIALSPAYFVVPKVSSFANNPPQLLFLLGPTTPPANGCPTGSPSASNWYCDFQKFALPNGTGIAIQIKASEIDLGTTAPSFTGWNAVDTLLQQYTGFNIGVASITNVGNVTTATMAAASPGSWELGDWICLQHSPVSGYNNCFQLASVTYSAGTMVSATWNQTSPVSADNSGSATMANSCGANLGSAVLCKIVPILRHSQNNPAPITPTYVYGQPYANAVCPGWIANKHILYHECVKVGTHYYHSTVVGTDGSTITSASNPNNWSTSGGTSVDNTVTWQDDGLNAFPQEAICGTGFVGDATAPPAGSYVASGIIFNINSNVCNGGAGACTTTDVASCLPLGNETPWRTWFNTINAGSDGSGNLGWLRHFAAASYAGQLGYNRIGGWIGGEYFGWLEATITNAAWWNMTYAQYQGMFVDYFAADGFANNAGAYASVHPSFKIMTAMNTYSGCIAQVHCQDFFQEFATVAQNAMAGYGIGSQGLQAGDGPAWAAGNVNANNVGNWIPLFNKYCETLAVSPCELQSFFESCPDNQVSGQCPANAITNGSLRVTLPLATSHNASSMEVYATDGLCAFDSNYTTANGNTTHATFADCQADGYQTVFANAALGVPTNTEGWIGHSGAIGKSGKN